MENIENIVQRNALTVLGIVIALAILLVVIGYVDQRTGWISTQGTTFYYWLVN